MANVDRGITALDEARARRAQEEDDRKPVPPRFSDDALCNEFVARHGEDLRFVAAWGKWLRWDGKRWAEDRTIAVYDLVRAVCRDAAAESTGETLARQIASAKTIAAVERLARSDQLLATLPEAFDRDAFTLNTPAGTVDLRTGEIRVHRREDLLTKVTTASPDDAADDALWLSFLRAITCSDEEIEAYLQRLFGYTLSADTRDHVLPFLYGVGANGKSTLVDLMLHILGDYGRRIPAETLMETRGERHPTDIASLFGTRLAVASEIEEGMHWGEARIKSLTGDATLAARYMRQDFFTFSRTHKLVVVGNHKPAIRVVDDAIRRRIHLVPFAARFAGDRLDRDMPTKLQVIAPAVLAWAVRGCQDWLAAGLAPPESVMAATTEYLESQDTLGMWIAEQCDTSDPTARASSSRLYGMFKEWKEARGERPPSMVRFSGQLQTRHAKEKDTATGRMVFCGIQPK